MRCVGQAFTHLVGQRVNRRKGLYTLLKDSELLIEKGDVVEVRIHIVPKDMAAKNRRVKRELKRTNQS